MKRFRAVALFMDKSFQCRSFDERNDAEAWCKRRERDGEMLWALVIDYVRGDMVFDLDKA